MKLPGTLNLAQALFWIANTLGGYRNADGMSDVLPKLTVEDMGSEPSLYLAFERFRQLDPGNLSTKTDVVLGQERKVEVRGGGGAAKHWSDAERQLLDKLQTGALTMKGREYGRADDSIAPIPADDFHQIRFGQTGDGNTRAFFKTRPDRFWDMLLLSSDAVVELWPIGAVAEAAAAQPQSSTKGRGRTDAKLRAVMQALQHLHPEPPLSRDLKGNLTSVASILGWKVSMSTLRRAWDRLWPK
jgi:hypothetical protein